MSAPRKSRLLLAGTLPVVAATALVSLPAGSASAAGSTSIVINEVFGGGGNGGSTYTTDFVELKNIGDDEVDVSNWSVQYASASGDSYQVTDLTGQIPAGDSYLVAEATGSGGTTPLPDPDVEGSIAMAGGAGKVALVSSKTALSCTIPACDTAPGVVDYVGYGPTANDSENAPTTPPLTSTTSAARDAAGTDTDNNAADFTAGAPTPTACGDACVAPSQPSSIAAIQGAAHLSPLSGDSVTDVTGVITARAGSGYYLQDPRGADAPGYVDGASSGLFVFTSGAPAAELVPGTSVSVDGTVSEFRPGSSGLTVTELTNADTTVVASDQPVPPATLVGPGGLTVPSTNIDDDADGGAQVNVETDGDYQPAQDGIDFWESLEGMRIELDDSRVVGPTNVTYGETSIVPAGSGTATQRGGIVLLPNDPNPERIVLDDALGTVVPKANVGDTYAGPLYGVVDYDFNNFHLRATQRPTLAKGGLTREVADPSGHDELSVATFNVENLDPTDPQSKFDDLAEIIVDNLASPDLLTLEEVQDNDGAADSGTTDADVTLQQLVDAISAAGGPSYSWQQINPRNDQEGGEPGGNIRVAFLVRDGTPLSFVEHAPGTPDEDTDVTEAADGSPELTHSPGRVDPDNAAWEDTRVPLAGQFMFGGQEVFVVANHWSSKGGDQPLFGPNQPPFQGSEAKRVQQGQTVNDFVDEIYAVDPTADVVVLGDLNDFEYSDSVTTLTDDGAALQDLPATLPDDERYTYVYEGNSQVLDHILLSPNAADQGYDYDVVHVNSEFNDQVSDHDPQVVDLQLGLPSSDVTAGAHPHRIEYGHTTTISGKLSDDSGSPITGATVRLELRASANDAWSDTESTAVTDGRGRYEFTVSPSRTTDYRVVYDGDATYGSTSSSPIDVKVATRVSLAVGKTVLKKGDSTLFAGVVAPNHADQVVRVQRLGHDGWEAIASVTLDQDSFYQYVLTTSKHEKKGTTSYRVIKPADADHVVGRSRTVDITIH